jgi:hypothetical protein
MLIELENDCFFFSNRRSGSRKSGSKLGEDTVDSVRLTAAQPAAVPTKSSGQYGTITGTIGYRYPD